MTGTSFSDVLQQSMSFAKRYLATSVQRSSTTLRRLYRLLDTIFSRLNMPQRSNSARSPIQAAGRPERSQGYVSPSNARSNLKSSLAESKANSGISTGRTLPTPASASTSTKATKLQNVRAKGHGASANFVAQKEKGPTLGTVRRPAAKSHNQHAFPSVIPQRVKEAHNKHGTVLIGKPRSSSPAPMHPNDKRATNSPTAKFPSTKGDSPRPNANINAHGKKEPTLVVTDDQGCVIWKSLESSKMERKCREQASKSYEGARSASTMYAPSLSTAQDATDQVQGSQHFLADGHSSHRSLVERVPLPLLRGDAGLLPSSSTRTSVALYGRLSPCVDYLLLPQHGLNIQIFHPIERSALPSSLTLSVAKHLYQIMRDRQGQDTKWWARDAGDAAFVTQFETRQMSLAALQIWMWTHPDPPTQEQRNAEETGTSATMVRWPLRVADRWQSRGSGGAVMDVTEHDYGNYLGKHYDFRLPTETRPNESAAGALVPTTLATDAPRFVTVNAVDVVTGRARKVDLENYLTELGEEQWEQGVVQGQIPYQPGPGARSPTRGEMGHAWCWSQERELE